MDSTLAIKLIAKLISNTNISDQKIIFYLNGRKIGEAITNNNGIATFYYTIPNAGVFTFSAEYKGNEYFINSSAIPFTLYIFDDIPIHNDTNTTNKTNKSNNTKMIIILLITQQLM